MIERAKGGQRVVRYELEREDKDLARVMVTLAPHGTHEIEQCEQKYIAIDAARAS